jgi:hypothetical protein
VTDAAPAIWCETCSRLAPMDEWRRKLNRIRVAVGTRIVGYVSTYEHRACRVFTAVLLSRRTQEGRLRPRANESRWTTE